jgi:hypothetical protein
MASIKQKLYLVPKRKVLLPLEKKILKAVKAKQITKIESGLEGSDFADNCVTIVIKVKCA